MLKMAVFPLFVELKAKKCVVFGGGKVAYRKVNTLLEFEAQITVVTKKAVPEMEELGEEGKITLKYNTCAEEEIKDAFLVVAATSDRDLNSFIARESSKRNIPVNVADSIEESTFFFPAIVKKEGVVIGISTSAASPALARKIREEIENLFPAYFEEMFWQLKEMRKKVKDEVNDPLMRQRILKRIAEELNPFEQKYSPAELEFLLQKSLEEYLNEKNN